MRQIIMKIRPTWQVARQPILSKETICLSIGLGNIGNSNVVLGGEKARKIVFNQYPQRVTSITWLDNQALFEFEQALDGTLTIYANAFQYGTHLIDRVATITVED